jgi:signal peptidase I
MNPEAESAAETARSMEPPPEVASQIAPAANGGAAVEAPVEAQAQASEAPVRATRKRIDPAGSLGVAQSLAGTVVIAVFVITFLMQAFQIPSYSMENTLLVGDYLLVDKVHFASGGVWGHVLPYTTIHRGDIVVFRYPVHPEQHFVKRVVGVPGDRVRLVNKQVFVNGVPVAEPYVIHRAPDLDLYRDDFPQPNMVSPNLEAHWWLEMRRLVRGGELQVPEGRYFVLGDNRDVSLDSRYWGFVPRENIIGRPLVIYLSLRSLTEPEPPLPDDKLARFGVLGQLASLPRWQRTFLVVK